MGISYVTGDATDPIGDGHRIIAHIVTDAGKWGRGFVMAVSRRYPQAKAAYLHYHLGGKLQLGQMFYFGHQGDGIIVANMVAQHGTRSADNPTPIRYDALGYCLGEVGILAASFGASVHMPRIGTGLAGGSWDKIEPLIEEHLCAAGVAVTVYDLPTGA